MSEESGTAGPVPHEPEHADSGGDPVCWLNRVCVECGLFLEDMAAPTCPRCGTAIDIP